MTDWGTCRRSRSLFLLVLVWMAITQSWLTVSASRHETDPSLCGDNTFEAFDDASLRLRGSTAEGIRRRRRRRPFWDHSSVVNDDTEDKAVVKRIISRANEKSWDFFESVRHHRTIDTVSSGRIVDTSPVRNKPPLDAACITNQNVTATQSSTSFTNTYFRKGVLWLSVTIVFRSFATLLFANDHHLFDKMAGRLLSLESAAAVRTIRTILRQIGSHGVIDIFADYSKRDVWMSIYALSRLQRAARWYDDNNNNTNNSKGILLGVKPRHRWTVVQDNELLDRLAHYAVYASVAYGWTMDVAFTGRIRYLLGGGGSLETLLRRTKIPRGDVVTTSWESRTHRPAYFIVRDRVRKTLVLCLRGTWSPHDILTSLCCTPEDRELSSLGKEEGASLVMRGHHGMLEAAQAVQKAVEDVIRSELDARPDFKLVLVGHSMGGGVAALLGMLWEPIFPDLMVYAYGPPCVIPLTDKESTIIKSESNVISVVGEDDPFSCLSLGHVADASVCLSNLCKNEKLGKDILLRTVLQVEEMSEKDLGWCSRTMVGLRRQMTNEKLYPPGKILYLYKAKDSDAPVLVQVPPAHFRDLLIRPRMFDLTRHAPIKYVEDLRRLADKINRSSCQ